MNLFRKIFSAKTSNKWRLRTSAREMDSNVCEFINHVVAEVKSVDKGTLNDIKVVILMILNMKLGNGLAINEAYDELYDEWYIYSSIKQGKSESDIMKSTGWSFVDFTMKMVNVSAITETFKFQEKEILDYYALLES